MFNRIKLLRLVSVAAVIYLFPLYSDAQHFFSYRLTGGLANYPMHDFIQKFSHPNLIHEYNITIDKKPFEAYAGLAAYRKLTWKSYTFIEIEYLKTSVYLDKSVLYYDWYSGWDSSEYFHWDLWLHSIPVSLGYEKREFLKSSRISPFYQIGGTVLYSTVQSQCWGNQVSSTAEQKTGFGYGFFGAFGLSFPTWNRLAGVVKARARYADGLHFTGDFAGFKAEFSSFDLSVGMEYAPCRRRPAQDQGGDR
jgi:hypothetical protein